ncbi:MAG TPA: DNA starvation/stationary phase protection protein [Nocardioidaceae bacterium]|nr:DNA starvation/stationary phase protection protein [Nocardioidaceae bacterium]
MTKIDNPLSADAQKTTAEELQATLIELIDISLVGKQAHWNVVGSHFRSVHLQLDELVAAARSHADVIAERAVALGANPDGSPETVVAERTGGAVPTGYLPDDDAIGLVVDRLGRSIGRIREAMRAVEETDPASQDLLNSVLLDLEKQSWMFQAMLRS